MMHKCSHVCEAAVNISAPLQILTAILHVGSIKHHITSIDYVPCGIATKPSAQYMKLCPWPVSN